MFELYDRREIDLNITSKRSKIIKNWTNFMNMPELHLVSSERPIQFVLTKVQK